MVAERLHRQTLPAVRSAGHGSLPAVTSPSAIFLIIDHDARRLIENDRRHATQDDRSDIASEGSAQGLGHHTILLGCSHTNV
jgi:hypothetical protein